MKQTLKTSLLIVPFLTIWMLLPLSLYAQGQATFLYTNDNASPNTVTAFSVAANGALTQIGVFQTGGQSGSGFYFASNNVTVGAAGNFLFVSNSGSNDVSVFTIDPNTGRLSLVGTFPTGGSGDISLAVTPDGKFLMAGNAGSSNVTVFSIAANGDLTPITGSPFPAGNTPVGMKISPNGAFLATGGGPVAVLNIASNGDLTPVSGSPFNGSGADAGIDIRCSGNQLFAGNATSGFTTVDVFSIAASGTLNPIPGSPFQPGVGMNSNGVLLSPHNQFLFVSNQFSDSITVFKVAANGGLTLVLGSPFPVNSGAQPSLMATNQAGTFLFTANFSATGIASIGVFSVASDGSLTEVGAPVPVEGSFLNAISVFPASTCTNPVPTISQPLVPDATPAGGSGFTLTVNGAGFVANSLVNWNGSALPTTVVNDNQVTATVSAANIAVAGTASVTVISPAPGGGTSNVAFFTTTTPTSTVSFSSSLVGVEVNPQDVVVADFNNDGKQDLAVVNECGTDPTCSSPGPGTVSILLGNGDGTFSTQSTPTVGHLPASAAVGDFNGDHKLDLAICNITDSTVSILLGNGDGTFQNQVTYGSNGFPSGISVGDFNGDGILDLAVTDNGSDQVSILLGNGDGTFQNQVTYSTGLAPDGITVGDFNGDGILDLAVADLTSNDVTILLGNGDGTFRPTTRLQVGTSPVWVVTGDFNGDGKLDLAVSNSGDNTVSILLGNGDGTFQSQVTYSTDLIPLKVTVGDFNGDGNLDLAVANYSSNDVSILFGNGDGTFQAALNAPTGQVPWAVTAGDFNGDGRLDLAVTNSYDNTVSILLQSPIVSLSPLSLDFGSQPVNTTSAPLGVLLSNTGSADLNISSISIAGTNGGDFAETNDCIAVSPGGSCNIDVTFTPTALGPRSATLSISDNAPGSPQTVGLSGTGTTLAGPTCAPAVQSTSTLFMISVTANCSDLGGGTIVSITIDWGDGSQPTLGSSGTHTYAAAGTYTVTVTATDDLGQVGHAYVPVILTAPPPPAPAGDQTMLTFRVPRGTPASSFSCTSAIGPDGQFISNLGTVGISCTFSTPPGSPNQDHVNLTIKTTDGGMAVLRRPRMTRFSTSLAFWMPFPAIVILGSGLFRRRSKRNALSRYVTMGLLVVCLATLSSCGGGFTPSPPQRLTTPAGTYYINAVGSTPDPIHGGFQQLHLIVPLTVTGP